MTESDLELLEMYLDDALSDGELAAMAQRIAEEPELAAELENLRVQRELRSRVWAALEPGDAAVERLLGRVDESVRRRTNLERQLRWGRWIGAAAACILVGFTTGYMGRGGSSGEQGSANIAMNSNNQIVQGMQVADSGGHINFVGKVPTAQVQLTDDSGKVIAVQPFESMDKANEFVSDIQAWQDRQKQMQNGNVVLMGGKF